MPRRRGVIERSMAENLCQGRTVDQLHGKERLPIDFTHLIDGDQVVVLQLSGRLRFSAKTLANFPAFLLRQRFEPFAADDLECHAALSRSLVGPIDDSHSTASDFS